MRTGAPRGTNELAILANLRVQKAILAIEHQRREIAHTAKEPSVDGVLRIALQPHDPSVGNTGRDTTSGTTQAANPFGQLTALLAANRCSRARAVPGRNPASATPPSTVMPRCNTLLRARLLGLAEAHLCARDHPILNLSSMEVLAHGRSKLCTAQQVMHQLFSSSAFWYKA